MGVLSFLTGGLKPITDLVDNLHTSAEEKLQLRNELAKMELELGTELLKYEGKLVEAKSSTIIAEAGGESLLQRIWRPVIMLEFGFIVFWIEIAHPILGYWLTDLPVLTMPDGGWTLLQIGLGGYVVGRSGEKIVKRLKM